MSGTSLDGLDIAFCRFELKDNGNWEYQIEEAECIEYDEYWQNQLNDAPNLSGYHLMVLHKDYGQFIGERVNNFTRKNDLKPDLISSHGHTVFHDPGNRLSFQLGDGAAIYATTSIPTVCDFRALDVCLGGQGAPLVPIGDALLFKEYHYCLNLGGIANISFDKNGKRLAYDICGCNLLLNKLAVEKGLSYDKNGILGSQGKINDTLLLQLNAWSYLSSSPPKSLDKETMLGELLPIINGSHCSVEDKLATVVEHISYQVSNAIAAAGKNILITGGGVFNRFLMEKIREKSKVNCIVPDEKLIQYKEALIFAFLGLLRVRNEVNSLATVTGAKQNSMGGALYGAINFD